MMLSLLLRIFDGLLVENAAKGKGRKAAIARAGLFGICGMILLCVRDVPDQLKAFTAELKAVRSEMTSIDKRLSIMELRYGVTPQADNAPATASETTRGAGATNQLAKR